MSRRLLPRLASALLTLSLLTAFLPRLAVCIGPGDHRAIEPLDARCCHQASTAEPAMADGHSACTPEGVDTPLISGPALTTTDSAGRHHDTSSPPALSAPLVTDLAMSVAELGIPSAAAGATARPPRAQRRTVNLC